MLCLKKWFFVCLMILVPCIGNGGDNPPDAEKLLNAAQISSDKKHYLEAIDLLEKARDILESSGGESTGIFADVLYSLAQTKIKARLHQDFPANYVKTALQDVQASNKLRERLSGVLPQKMAEGYYLEGLIQKKFFLRSEVARACFRRAMSIDPTFAAAKRELSELLASEEQK